MECPKECEGELEYGPSGEILAVYFECETCAARFEIVDGPFRDGDWFASSKPGAEIKAKCEECEECDGAGWVWEVDPENPTVASNVVACPRGCKALAPAEVATNGVDLIARQVTS